MYHMLPYAYRPQTNYSRNQHGEFQNVIASCVQKILRETEIVDADSLNGRKLFNSIDTFFSYGLLSGDGAYWRCIRVFLPKAEQKMLMAECGNANDRFLSIGWLKTSFNKGTLHFMLLALCNQSNKIYLAKYYHINACIRNSGLLEAVTGYIEQLQPIQFAYYSTRQLREEPATAAVISTEPVQMSLRAAARQRKLTEKEASSDTVPNIIPREVPSILTQAIDQDVLLDELVRNRHNRLHSELYDTQNHVEEEEDVFTTVHEEEERLEDVMTKKMSCANMESLDPDGIEQILASVTPEENTSIVYNLSDGEYQMSQGDVLHFAINVFEKSSEKIIETFEVMENFYSDAKKMRYFVMTNYNFYVFKFRSENSQVSSKKTNMSSEGFFIPLIRIPHDRIKTIRISIDNLSFMLEADENGFTHYVHNEEKDDQSVNSYSAAMAGLECGAHVINSLINVVEHSSRNLTSNTEIDDHIGYMCMLQPNIEKQLGRVIDVRAASLCFWYEQTPEDQENSTSAMAGYLFKTNVNTWMKSTEEPEHKYCVISGKSFVVFADSSCQDENLAIDLLSSTLMPSGKNTFQLKGPHGNYAFECSTQEEFNDWTKSLTFITEKKGSEPFIAPCLTIFTETTIALVQEGEKFWSDGFLRIINDLDVNQLEEAIIVTPSGGENRFVGQSPTFCLISKNGTVHYFFMRFEKELLRLAMSFESCFGIKARKLDDVFKGTPIGKTIYNTCCSVKDLWC